jgi:hypothetical protein
MRIERHKNFLTRAECDALNAWVDLGVQNKWLDLGFHKGIIGQVNRVTSRMYGERYKYPQLVRDISDKIRAFCGVASYGLIEGHGRDGVVVSCTFNGGDVYAHRDPTDQDGIATLRCNVMTRAPKAGGLLYVAGQALDLEAGELHCYLASEYLHFVTPVEGDTPRILWMFGAHVPANDWDSGLIKFGAN